jgi:hypothetical protein
MIQFSSHRTAINVASVAAGASVLYGLAVAKRGHRRGPLLLGLVVGAAAVGARLAADHQDKEIVRNPEVMNGHFLTDGSYSALADADDVPYLRSLMGVPPRGSHADRVR